MRSVVAVDKITMSVIAVFRSASEAARAHGVNESTIGTQASRHAVPRGRVMWRYADEYDANESLAGKSYRPIDAFNVRTGERFIAANVFVAAEKMGARAGAVRWAISKGYRVNGTWRVRFAR